MKKIQPFPLIALIALIFTACTDSNTVDSMQEASIYPINPVEFTEVHVNDNFWQPWLELNREVTIPSSFKKCEETGRIENFKVAGGLSEGKYQGVFPFDDSDVYKIIEGASYSLLIHPDPELEAYIDSLILYIRAAQEPDGYLHTWRTIDPSKPPTDWSGNEHRWSDIGGGHELYNMGHFYEAAVAHFKATGKRSMLDIAIRNADLIVETFAPGTNMPPPGHQEIEIGLVKLYSVTGIMEYLELARHFLDQRGKKEGRDHLFGEYSQDHLPVVEQSEAVGHAVRAGYMYTAMADIAAITGDSAYIAALERIWENVVGKKIYLTGGLGGRGGWEGFAENYELPNFTAYNETCAAIAGIFWNYRMFLLSGESKYMDVLERILYNGMIAGLSLSGDHFFYPNPLASDGETPFNVGACTRSPWFDCSCCPSNVTRFVPSIPGYIYGTDEEALFVNLFIGNTAEMHVSGNRVRVTQTTNYPWDNKVSIVLEPQKRSIFSLMVRIPGWARNEVLPSDLYSYINDNEGEVLLHVNGKLTTYDMKNGYAVIDRKWKAGDVVEITLPMDVRIVKAHEKVIENKGKVAVECGPLVYCAEETDNDADIFNIQALPETATFKKTFREDLLGGIQVITTTAPVYGPDHDDGLSGDQSTELILVPYHRWSNREVGKMTVWFPAK